MKTKINRIKRKDTRRKLVVDLDARPEVRNSLDRACLELDRSPTEIVVECLKIGLRYLAPVTEKTVEEHLKSTAEALGITENQAMTKAVIAFAAAVARDGRIVLDGHDRRPSSGRARTR